jgi:hypothetical protein
MAAAVVPIGARHVPVLRVSRTPSTPLPSPPSDLMDVKPVADRRVDASEVAQHNRRTALRSVRSKEAASADRARELNNAFYLRRHEGPRRLEEASRQLHRRRV